MTGLQYLLSLHEVCKFQTKEGEKVGWASNSELRRWLRSGVVHVNGKPLGVDDQLPEEVVSVVLFPNNSKSRCTLF